MRRSVTSPPSRTAHAAERQTRYPRLVVVGRRVAIEHTVERKREWQRTQEVDLLRGEPAQHPIVGDARRLSVTVEALDQIAVGIPDDVARVGSAARELERLGRERSRDDVAAEHDRVGVDLVEHGFERRQVAVDVVQRGDAHVL